MTILPGTHIFMLLHRLPLQRTHNSSPIAYIVRCLVPILATFLFSLFYSFLFPPCHLIFPRIPSDSTAFNSALQFRIPPVPPPTLLSGPW